ncbi:MAG: fimbrillin family protein [Paraprevotella sp.]|nr:fimbrillin family protein [Paraprevotella sp.]
MKQKHAFFALAAFSMLAAACSSEDSSNINNVQNAKYITVQSSIGHMTRVTTDGENSESFADGDKISVYAWTGSATEITDGSLVVNNSINTLGNGTWTAEPQMLWKDSTTPHYFLGVYPTRQITNFTADADTLDNASQEQSDLLVALQPGDNGIGLTAQANPVSLTFDHVMAKLIVNLTFRNQWSSTPTVSGVKAPAETSATINYLTKTVTATQDAKQDVSLSTVSANTRYASIMVPQTGFNKIVITIDGKDYTYNSTTDIQLESGKYTTVNLIVGRDRIELGDVSVNDWQAGNEINGGEAQTD